jgi:hypothetical protein
MKILSKRSSTRCVLLHWSNVNGTIDNVDCVGLFFASNLLVWFKCLIIAIAKFCKYFQYFLSCYRFIILNRIWHQHKDNVIKCFIYIHSFLSTILQCFYGLSNFITHIIGVDPSNKIIWLLLYLSEQECFVWDKISSLSFIISSYYIKLKSDII